MLTELGLKALSIKDIGRILYDEGSIRGKVRATKAGISVSFSFRYKFNGNSNDISVGTWPKKSLKDIRAKANNARGMLTNQINPIDAIRITKIQKQIDLTDELAAKKNQQEQLLALSQRMTINNLFQLWLKLALKDRKDNGKEISRMFLKDVLPVIGEMAVADVRKAHISLVINNLIERGVNRMAKMILALMRQMFRFAQDQDIIENDPTSSIRKSKIGGKDTVRDRVLSDDEIRTLTIKIRNARLLTSSECAIWIMLSTLARIGELCKAEWAHIDIVNGRWKIPKENSKNGKPHIVHLSPFALSQFKKLASIRTSNKWLFPNRNDSHHVTEKSISKQVGDRQLSAARKSKKGQLIGRSKETDSLKLGDEKWTPHDLRRTGATIMGNLGVRPDVIERCLNHVEQSKMAKTYQHQQLNNEQKEAWFRLGEHLTLVANPANKNVLPMLKVRPI